MYIAGTSRNDRLTGSGDPVGDTIFGYAGDDVITASRSLFPEWPTADKPLNWLHGGDGHDKIYGGNGENHLIGGGGDDKLFGTDHSRDTAFGGTGRDYIDCRGGDALIFGGAQKDRILLHTGDSDPYAPGESIQAVFDFGKGDQIRIIDDSTGKRLPFWKLDSNRDGVLDSNDEGVEFIENVVDVPGRDGPLWTDYNSAALVIHGDLYVLNAQNPVTALTAADFF